MKRLFFNRALRILLATNGLILLSAAMLGPIYALFVTEIGGDLLDASLTGAIFALAAGITTFLSGKYSDHIKENELVVAFGYTVMGFGFLLYTLVTSIWFLFGVQVIIGFGEAIYAPAYDALYSKHLDGRKSGTQWGAWESMNYFATAVGAIIGGLIVSTWGFTPIFVLMASFCFGSSLYIYFLPRKLL